MTSGYVMGMAADRSPYVPVGTGVILRRDEGTDIDTTTTAAIRHARHLTLSIVPFVPRADRKVGPDTSTRDTAWSAADSWTYPRPPLTASLRPGAVSRGRSFTSHRCVIDNTEPVSVLPDSLMTAVESGQPSSVSMPTVAAMVVETNKIRNVDQSAFVTTIV